MKQCILALLLCLSFQLFGTSIKSAISNAAQANYYENSNLDISNSDPITSKPVVIVHDGLFHLFSITANQLQVNSGPYGKKTSTGITIPAPISYTLSNINVDAERSTVAAVVETAGGGPLFVQRFNENLNGIAAFRTWIQASPPGASLSSILVSNANIFVFYKDADQSLYMTQLPAGQNGFLPPQNISHSPVVSFSFDRDSNGNIIIGFIDTSNNGIVTTVDSFSLEIKGSETFSNTAKDFITLKATIQENIQVITFRDTTNTPYITTLKNGQTIQKKPLASIGSSSGYMSSSINNFLKGSTAYYNIGNVASATRFSVDINANITITHTETLTDFAPTQGLTSFINDEGNSLVNLLDGSAHPRVYSGLHDSSFSLLAISNFTANTTKAPYIFNFNSALNRGILPFIDTDGTTVHPSVVTVYNSDVQLIRQQSTYSPLVR